MTKMSWRRDLITMNVTTIANIFAVLFAPIVAVWVGQVLLDRTEKRKDKMSIFRSLVSSRVYGWTVESVNALNLIELVFYKDENVCQQWRKYYESLNVKAPADETQIRKMQFEQDELIRVMGKTLKYSDDAIAQIIRTPYMPIGMSNQMQSQQKYQDMQLATMQALLGQMEKKENG